MNFYDALMFYYPLSITLLPTELLPYKVDEFQRLKCSPSYLFCRFIHLRPSDRVHEINKILVVRLSLASSDASDGFTLFG